MALYIYVVLHMCKDIFRDGIADSMGKCKYFLIYVAKLPFREVLPTSTPMTIDESLNQVLFQPFLPNVNSEIMR